MVYAQQADAPKSRRRQAKIDRILEATRHIAVAEGVGAVSIKRVANAADYTPGALYRYFASKDALLSAVVVQLIDELAITLDSFDVAIRDEGGLTRIAGQAVCYRAHAEAHPHAFALLSQLVAEPQEVIGDESEARPIIDSMLSALTPVARAIGDAAQEGALDRGDVEARTQLLFASLQGCLLLRKQERRSEGRIDASQLAALALRTLLVGWGAAPSSADIAVERADRLHSTLTEVSS